MLTLNTPLFELHQFGLPRIGKATSLKLATEIAALNGRPDIRQANIEDLLHYLPMRYEDRSNLATVADLQDGITASVEVRIRLGGIIPFKGGRIKMYEFLAEDSSGSIRAFWWNQIYLNRVFDREMRVILYGQWKWNRHKGIYEVENPDYEIMSGDDEAESIHTSRRVPVYRKLGDFRTRQLRSIFFHVINSLDDQPQDPVPNEIATRLELLDRLTALRQVHFPADDTPVEMYTEARSESHRRLIFEELFWLAVALKLRKSERELEPREVLIEFDDRIKAAIDRILPFNPTGAQKRVLEEIVTDLTGDHPMNRLLQGDVGCGKTIVALQAMVIAVENGYQAALMAPTEILAEQHARNIRRFVEQSNSPYRVVLLTGSLKAKEKKAVQEAIATGEADMIIGTHALIQEAVKFCRLGLAVVDEQHRFGVLQRAALRRTGLNPDVLVMTATPIPRSLAMTIYGDLDVSIIDELPPGRTPVRTFVRGENKREKIYEFIRNQIKSGRQAYVVYPIIQESEKLDLRNATEMYNSLQSEIFPEFGIGLLHGKMKPAEKEAVMAEFLANGTQILVATTVIEVGVDVPNATVMVIEHAERFGLSQLHQLRGRVGRGAGESFCILLAQYARTDVSRQRLEIMEQTTDGFRIAEEDLAIRGPGEVMGTRQSGVPAFRIANIVRDQKLLQLARREADMLLTEKRLTREADEVIHYVRELPRFQLASIG